MDSAEGRDLVRALAERSDILVEDRTPGYLAGLGLGYEELRKLNPALVYVSITPFGQTGPHAGYRGGDLITQSTSGMMIANGDDGTRPCMAPYEITAQVGCVQAAFGALLAIRARRTTGRGQHVDLSLQEATISSEHPYIYRYSHENVITRREGKHSPFGAVNTYLCADGAYANISVYNDGHFARLARDIMEHPILSEDVWMNRTVRRENRELIDTLLEEYTETVECDELVERGQRIGIPVTPVMTVDGFVHHPHTEAREFFVEMDHPVIGRHRAPGPPVQFGASPWQATRPAPLLGQHTEEVLQEINDIQPRRLDFADAADDSPAQTPRKPLRRHPCCGHDQGRGRSRLHQIPGYVWRGGHQDRGGGRSAGAGAAGAEPVQAQLHRRRPHARRQRSLYRSWSMSATLSSRTSSQASWTSWASATTTCSGVSRT